MGQMDQSLERSGCGLQITPTTSPVTVFPLNASDFFRFDDLLSEEEKQIRKNTRAFAEKELFPLVVDAWEKAEFPKGLVSIFQS